MHCKVNGGRRSLIWLTSLEVRDVVREHAECVNDVYICELVAKYKGYMHMKTYIRSDIVIVPDIFLQNKYF